MRFSIFSTALMAFSGTVTATKIVTAEEVAANIGELTAKAQGLIEPASSLTIASLAFDLLGGGPWPQILQGLNDIITTSKKQITYMQDVETNPTKFAGEEAQLITDGLKGLVKVISQVLNSLIDQQKGLLANIPIVSSLLSPVLLLLQESLIPLINSILDSVEPAVKTTLATDLGSVTTLDDLIKTAYLGYLIQG